MPFNKLFRAGHVSYRYAHSSILHPQPLPVTSLNRLQHVGREVEVLDAWRRLGSALCSRHWNLRGRISWSAIVSIMWCRA